MSTRMRKTDVVIIGLGASGGYAALALTQAGVDVTAPRGGAVWSPEDFPMDELRNDVRNFMSQPKAAKEIPTWREDSSQVATQTGTQILMMKDGRGFVDPLWNGAVALPGVELPRALQLDQALRGGLDSVELDRRRLAIDYADLEPWYDKVEYDIGVSGRAGTSTAGRSRAATTSRRRGVVATRCRRCVAVASTT